ncbi:MAG: Tetratricopeptide repeat-containing protein, partial [Ilumatobacteraceae bacterium]|nr:Tetratricopeptide repeat-containing protein [Ilumatobacteraceae bacterium]
VAGDDEIASMGAQAAAAAATDRATRLLALRERVSQSGLPCWQYPDPRQLGQRVLADLTALVDRLYPADDVPDLLDRDASAHAAFGAAQTTGHIARPQLAGLIDDAVAATGPPLTITGEPGMDLPAIAVTWLDAWRTANPTDVVVQHHLGATADAADWMAMAGRLVGELARAHGFAGDPSMLPADAAGRRAALFAAFDHAGRSDRRTVVVVTGADLLTDVDGAPDLTWLPSSTGPALQVVLATSGGRPLAEARRRGWPVIDVPPLDDGEKRLLIRTFLGRYAKGLDEVHVAHLSGAPTTGNVLFLRTVLDELRQHGDHFTLGAVISHYLSATTVDQLLALVLERYEGDFERDRPGLVRDSMSAVWAARRGITELELMDVLGHVATGGERITSAVWSPLVLAAEAGLVTRSGLLSFATEPHRLAVEQRYLATDEERRAAHAMLAATFASYDLGPRVVDELPWQQLGAGDLSGMVSTISDLRFTDVAYRQSYPDLRRLWARAADAGFSVVDGYRDVIEHPDQHTESTWEVARLVTDGGFPAQALQLNKALVQQYRGATDDVARRRLPASLVNLGAAQWLQGDLEAADRTLHEAIDLARPVGEMHVLQAALGDLALVRRDRGDHVAAVALFTEEESICRSRGDTVGLQANLGNRSELLRQQGDRDGALALAVEQEVLCRSIGDAAGVARALAGQGAILVDSGDRAAALDKFRAHGAVSKNNGDLRGSAESLVNQAGTLRELGRPDEAVAVATEAEALIRRLSDEPLLARVLDARARLAADAGQWADADRLSLEAVMTARSAGATAALVLALGIHGIARRELGDLLGARQAHDEEERAASANHDPAAIAAARVNLAAVDIASNDLDSALARYAQAEPVLTSMGLDMVLLPLFNNRWQVHAMRGETPAAIDDLKAGARCAGTVGQAAQCAQMLTKAVELLYSSGRAAEAEPVWQNLELACRSIGDDAGLQRAIGERAMLVLGRGDLTTAGPMFDEQEQICRRIGDQVGLAACVGNRAILLRQQGDLAGSLRCIDEQLELARASGNGQGLLFATANRGEVLGAMGRVTEGLAALGEARTMAANWHLDPMVAQLDQMISAMRAQLS